MDNSAYFEAYFSGTPDPDQVRDLEKRIASDPDFADELAFYLSAHTVAGEMAQSDKKQQFREFYQRTQADGKPPLAARGTAATEKSFRTTPIRKLIYYIAAAAVIAGFSFGIYTYVQRVSPQELAAHYEQENLKSLPVTMSSRADGIQTGLRLYNDGKLAEARVQFEKIIQSDSTDFNAKKYAGLSSLQLKEYDRALTYFKQLETYHGLYSNPALFYQALTLMSRNRPGDPDQARQLLQQVVQKDLEGRETAQEWLSKW